MSFRNKLLLIALISFVLQKGLLAQTPYDVVIGTDNIPITEVQFVYDGDTIKQTAGNPTTVGTALPVNLNYMKVNDGVGEQTILYPNSFGTVVRNNNFTPSVTGVGVYNQGTIASAAVESTFEPALESAVNSVNLLEYLFYDGAGNLPGGDDFDILFVKGIAPGDFVVVGERDGNTDFEITPLDINGNPMAAPVRKLKFGETPGTNSGNGSTLYDWNIGYAPGNQTGQPMMYTVVDAGLFNAGSNAIYGFRINNEGNADVKFFGLSDDSFADNPNNASIGGLEGNVFNDNDALKDNTVSGSGISAPDAAQLYATLYNDNTNAVIATMAIASDGSYEFLNLDASSDYGILISTTQGVVGNAKPTVALPAGWINTGETVGTGTGNDGNVNGDQDGLTVATSLVSEVNFGIEKRPTADSYSSAIASPDLNSFLVVGAGATDELSGNDEEDGAFNTGEKFGITSLPTNGNELYYNGVEITLGDDGTNPPSTSNPFTIASYDPSLLQVRFTGASSTSTTFEYVTVDAADEMPGTAATYELTYTEVVKGGLSGNVFNDADGLTDSTVDGAGIDDPETTPLYATLYDDGGSTVLASIAVQPDGSFEFLNLVPNADYSVLISTNQGTIGAALPAVALPTDWVNTGEFRGTGAGNDGSANGIQTGLSVGTTTLPAVNFGIEKRPTADSYTFAIPDPILNSFMEIGLGAKSSLTGNDFEDGVLDDGETFGITSLPTNGNELWYMGVKITLGQDGTNPPSLSNPYVINNYDPSLLQMRFTGVGSTSTEFEYVSIDAAGNIPAMAATYEMTYSAVVSGSLSGTIFNDADGLTDSTVDGAGIDDPEAEQLYATLYDAVEDTVIASIAVDTDGTFLFSLLTPDPDYGVLISTNQGTAGAALPAVALPTDWVNTGEFRGTGTGNDGTANGIQTGLSVGTVTLPNVNFGIEKRPTADSYTSAIANPASNSFFVIGSGATDELSGNDLEDGAFNIGEKFGITSLPTNGNEIHYDGSEITLGEDGINPPSASNPFVIDNYDPLLLSIRFTGPAQSATEFNYITIDAAGNYPSSEATYELTYGALPVEWVDFRVQKRDASGYIYFATASESNTSHFFVQKSTNGSTFRTIETIVAQGFSEVLNQYSYVDRVLNLGENYYRIAQVDADGSVDYTAVKSIVFNANNTTLVYPNPVAPGNNIRVKYFAGEENAIVTISNMQGHELIKTTIQNPIGWNEAVMDISLLPPGIYALRIGDKKKAVIFTIAE